MGKIHKITDKQGKGIYPVTVSDAVVIGNEKLTDKVTEIDASIEGIKENYLDNYKIKVGTASGTDPNTIYFIK